MLKIDVRKKPRNGVDIEPLRNSNIFKNHTLPAEIVNGQQDKSNVRNNPKVWTKSLYEEFVPDPLYENNFIDNRARTPMEIMTREEYEDLHHFPRTRKKYFDHTMHPNRFIFREDRAQTRDPTPNRNRNTLTIGGKSDYFVKDKHQSIDMTHHNKSFISPQHPYGIDDSTGNFNEVLYNKRVGEGTGPRLPPYTDMKYFSRTRQAYFDQDYIRNRAARTLNADPHRRKVSVPDIHDYADHAKNGFRPNLYNQSNKLADEEYTEIVKDGNWDQATMDTPEKQLPQ